MMTQRRWSTPLLAAALALGLAATIHPAPAAAQTAGASDPLGEARLRKLEAEVRALQTKVFPGGNGTFFAPLVEPGKTAPAPLTGTPATTAVSDILTRMDALEVQIARLTAANEENTNRIARLEAHFPAAASTTTPATTTPPAASTGAPVSLLPAAKPAPAATTPAAKPAPAATTTTPSAKRLAAVKAIAKPQTDDPAEDEYSYGYRLWEAKFQPEAQQQLKLYLGKYPRHARVSYARNLLGRSLLDEGNPREAAKWFLANYQAGKKGERAPDSLLYLATAMNQLKDTTRACVALAQFQDDYADEAAGRLKGQLAQTRAEVKCN